MTMEVMDAKNKSAIRDTTLIRVHAVAKCVMHSSASRDGRGIATRALVILVQSNHAL